MSEFHRRENDSLKTEFEEKTDWERKKKVIFTLFQLFIFWDDKYLHS